MTQGHKVRLIPINRGDLRFTGGDVTILLAWAPTFSQDPQPELFVRDYSNGDMYLRCIWTGDERDELCGQDIPKPDEMTANVGAWIVHPDEVARIMMLEAIDHAIARQAMYDLVKEIRE